ncbi:MAG: ABC transporter permease [Ignavibacteria bacterium]
MLINYLKIALRNLLRHKAYSAINILGLAIGISCFMLIFLFIIDEFSYDKFHSKADRIYRLIEIIDNEGQGEESSSAPLPVAKALYTAYPHYIESIVRLFDFQQPMRSLQIGDKKFNEKKLFFTDSTFFEIFDYKLAKGDPKTALNEPNSILLTQQTAEKLFGNEDPMGKTLLYEGNFNLIVKGVFEELPSQSHFTFSGLISYSTINTFAGPGFGTNWIWNPAWTYILLKEGVEPEDLEKEFPAFIQKNYPQIVKDQVTHYLQPLTSVHLHSDLDYEIEKNNKIATVYIFGAVGILILFIACINFMNLATARSAKRAREVGMRKVLGAERKQLIKQFIGESILISLIAVLISIFLVELLLPLFNSFSEKDLTFGFIANPFLLLVLFAVGLIVGVFAGTYPAFFLSSAAPIKTLKGKYEPGSRSTFLRRALVVAQFAISSILIIGTIIIYEQLTYMQNANLGFDKSQIVIIPTRPAMLQQIEVLKNEFLRDRNVKKVTVMDEIIGQHHNTHSFHYEGLEQDKNVFFPGLIVDEDFVETFDLKIVVGRNFSKEYPRDDSLSVILNEAMVRNLGWKSPEEALGKEFRSFNGNERVVGVVKDFNYVSLQEPIGPFFFDMVSFPFFKKFLAVKLKGNDIKNTIEHLEKSWAQVAPAFPFEFSFLDENLDMLYKAQSNLSKLIGYFSILAIFIACLGMFALSSFTAEQKTKEIGIRKVLGASTPGIVTLLSKEFLKLVLLANLFAWPVAYFAMNKWLDDFAFRINVQFWSFIAAAMASIMIALLTISYQSIKAAVANPIRSLRYE